MTLNFKNSNEQLSQKCFSHQIQRNQIVPRMKSLFVRIKYAQRWLKLGEELPPLSLSVPPRGVSAHLGAIMGAAAFVGRLVDRIKRLEVIASKTEGTRSRWMSRNARLTLFESRVFDLSPVGVHQSGFMPTENSRPLRHSG